MDKGYIKLWRKSLHDGWIKNHAVWIFWTYCLMKATHKEYNAMIGSQIVPLLPGQFVFGLYKAAEETGLSVQQIRTSIKFLEKSENLTSKTTNKFSVISIINWDIYQSQENESNNQINKPITNKQQTNNNIQEQKNKRTKEKKIYIPLLFENVQLTQKEYDNLNLKYGQPLIQKALKYYSDYKIEKGYKSKDDNLTIQRWVIDAVNKKEALNGTGNATFKRQIRTERDAINQAACDEADRIAKDYYLKHASSNDNS